MNVNIYQLFKASLMEPKRQAAVRIMTIGKIMQFIFVFVGLLTIVSFIEWIFGLGDATSSMAGLVEFMEEIEWLLYPFALVFLFVFTTLYHFIKISLFALIALVILNARKRRGEYRHLWRTTSLSVTVPTLLTFVLSFFNLGFSVSLATSLLTLLYLYLAIGYYPKKPPLQKK
ncbi:4-hydroxy-3-methylbut-2-en-1-yl diphosphate synthase [Planococcus antarcticus DSM 14505]|uniref:4-hydroxy-3-methylbut-2-en-1-yl diphosphate synthase n=1 Tax=Planococcus antarcticus DSM 14505 TaxID=1185653 RepID=A0ABN4RGN4_9BACL|nr:DUF1189 family protein [Planococcus antarcticus]ANU11185.1 4-hydroxy-3-methylbut-2-en-1-yl diphosphate synthase [Planococcus antarcticus DSM 14505]